MCFHHLYNLSYYKFLNQTDQCHLGNIIKNTVLHCDAALSVLYFVPLLFLVSAHRLTFTSLYLHFLRLSLADTPKLIWNTWELMFTTPRPLFQSSMSDSIFCTLERGNTVVYFNFSFKIPSRIKSHVPRMVFKLIIHSAFFSYCFPTQNFSLLPK